MKKIKDILRLIKKYMAFYLLEKSVQMIRYIALVDDSCPETIIDWYGELEILKRKIAFAFGIRLGYWNEKNDPMSDKFQGWEYKRGTNSDYKTKKESQ